MIKLADEVLETEIIGRNAKYTNVMGQRSAFYCHLLKCIYDAKRFIFFNMHSTERANVKTVSIAF